MASQRASIGGRCCWSAPKSDIVAKAFALADYLARRHKPSIGAIKRAVYFGSSLPLQDGIKLEANEFLTLDVPPEGQKRMLAYQAGTTLLGDLPLYVADQYETALEDGRTSASYR